jgi:hypothetical protein
MNFLMHQKWQCFYLFNRLFWLFFNFKMAKNDVYSVSGYKLDIASSTPLFSGAKFCTNCEK